MLYCPRISIDVRIMEFKQERCNYEVCLCCSLQLRVATGATGFLRVTQSNDNVITSGCNTDEVDDTAMRLQRKLAATVSPVYCPVNIRTVNWVVEA